MVSLKALQVSIFMYEVVSELMMVWCKYGRKVRDRARSSYGQGLVAKKKNLVGISRLNFYFLPYIFIFYIIFLKKKIGMGGEGGAMAPACPPFPPSCERSLSWDKLGVKGKGSMYVSNKTILEAVHKIN